MSKSRCCVNCFAHEWLCDFVRDNSNAVDDCDYCGHKDVPIVAIDELYEPFKNLMELYVPSNEPHGEMLMDLIQGDYEVFEDELHSSDKAAILLEDILRTRWDDDSGEPQVDAHKLYYRHSSVWYHTTMVEAWNEFCGEVKKNPVHEPNLPWLYDDELARMEVELPKGAVLYRARVGFISDEDGGIRPFERADMSAPPPEKVRPGRANAKGEVVLYVADQEQTAVAEVRPWRGLLVSVTEIKAMCNLRLVDLSKRPPPSNPFTDEAPQYELELEGLLRAFGEELGRPLRRADDPRDYLPCQKLVRRIRDCGFYDGIRYPSAMDRGGANIVLFDPKLVKPGPSKLVEVQGVGIAYDTFYEGQP
jgi:hypothetical protein